MRHLRKHKIFIAMLAVAAIGLIAAGCGDDDESATGAESTSTEVAPADAADAGGGGGTVDVSLGEMFIELDTDTIAAGKVTFDVTNDGKLDHEFIVIETDRAGGDLPVKDGAVDLEKAGKVVGGGHDPNEEAAGAEKGEEMEDEDHIEPGASATYDAELKPGGYVLICNIAGHYGAGQWAEFTVE